RGQKQVYDDLPEIEDPEDGDPTPSEPEEEDDDDDDDPVPPGPKPPVPPKKEEVKPKDPVNLERIDDKIEEKIEENVSAGDVVVTPATTTERTGEEDSFKKPEVKVENNAVKDDTAAVYSGDNNAATDRGGVSATNPNATKADDAGQAAAEENKLDDSATLNQVVNNFGFN
ncbi:MAG: hypothetical protein Q4B34_02090, partial [Candidatus Saccharibacteria bacterium]|nr:hypothetical protein [Candidatus Saccharibacteria bacterium]